MDAQIAAIVLLTHRYAWYFVILPGTQYFLLQPCFGEFTMVKVACLLFWYCNFLHS